MLENKTSKLVTEAKELMNLCVKQMGSDDIKSMSVTELDAIQRCLKLVDSACELSIEQAKMMDEINDKMDKLLRILEKMEEKGSE